MMIIIMMCCETNILVLYFARYGWGSVWHGRLPPQHPLCSLHSLSNTRPENHYLIFALLILSSPYALYQILWLTLFHYVIHCINNCKTCYWVQKRTSEIVGHVNFYHWRGLGTRGILSKRYNRRNIQIRPEWGGNTLQFYPRHTHKIEWGRNTNLNES